METIKDQNEFNALLSKGIKDFGNYEYLGKTLYCSYNQLVKLPALNACEWLNCSNNQLESKYFTISPTSLRSVFFIKNRNVILTGCFCGTPEEFYKKGFVNEKKQWVKDFYNQIKK